MHVLAQEDTTHHFAKMLRVNKGLRALSMRKHGIRDHGATLLAECALENTTLQVRAI